MPSSSNRLPSRFPVGTKFVIEGRRGGEGQVQVFSRYLEFPDGTFFPLPTHPVQRRDYPTVRQVARSQALGHWPRPNASKPLWANGKSRVGHWPTTENPGLRGPGFPGDRLIAFKRKRCLFHSRVAPGQRRRAAGVPRTAPRTGRLGGSSAPDIGRRAACRARTRSSSCYSPARTRSSR